MLIKQLKKRLSSENGQSAAHNIPEFISLDKFMKFLVGYQNVKRRYMIV